MYNFSKSLAALAGLLVLSMLLIGLSAARNSAVQNPSKSQVEGVWKIAEVLVPPKNPAEKATTITNPKPALIILTKGYYSFLAVRDERPAVAPAKDPANLTDAEKIARYEQWSPFTANSGTYEVKGSMLMFHPIVAKSVEVMTSGTPITWELKVEGPNSLWLTPTSERAMTNPRLKLTRLE